MFPEGLNFAFFSSVYIDWQDFDIKILDAF